MPALILTCPNCSASLKLDGHVPAGRAARCPKCRATVPLPSDTPDGLTTPSVGGDDAPVSASSFLAPRQAADEIGRLGAYRLLAKLGAGGMGMVFRAEDIKLGRQVALKVMLPQFAANDTAKQRFLREARAQAAVEHDHIAAIFQVDEADGVPFLAMPLLKGQSLATLLAGQRVPPVTEVVRIGREIAEGLSAAHDIGLIHRDIKPGNIWLEGAKRRVKILDFGLARSTGGDQLTMGTDPITASGTVVGTPAYMAPEQARGKQVDGRGDLFSLGVVLYQMATGKLPFEGPDLMAVLTSLAVDTPPPPGQLNRGLPPDLDALIQRLLAKDPARRLPSAAAVADALKRIEEKLTGTHAALPQGAGPNPWADIDADDGEPTTSVGAAAPVAKPRSLLPLALVGLTIVVFLLGVTAFIVRLRGWKNVPAADTGAAEARATSPREKPKPPPKDAQRELAEALLSAGGEVDVVAGADRFRARLKVELPDRPFVVVSVNFTGNDRVGDTHVAAARGITTLTRLILDGTSLTEAGLAVFSENKNLAELSLNGQNITPAGMAHFADITTVTELTLAGPNVTDAGLAHFGNHKRLTRLYLGGTQMTDAGLAHFKGCTEITDLRLDRLSVTAAGFAHFRDCKQLEAVQLWSSGFGNRSFVQLKDCPRLKRLEIHGQRVTDAGLKHLAGLATLKLLEVRGNAVTEAGMKKLAGQLPRCRITWRGGVFEPKP